LCNFIIGYFWNPIVGLFSDLSVLRERIAALGFWGPVALIGFSVVQVLAAPLPGYPLVIVSGILYGTWWGAIYANIGMLLAGTLAMGLTRRFGRPIAERFVERSHLQRLEHLLSGNNLWIWFVIMLLPTGDYPYFVAGLSQLTFRNFFIAMFLGRVPFTFVVTNAAERSAELPSEAILGVSIAMSAVGVVAYWQQARISRWFAAVLERWAPHPSRHEN
jgi:uncharacterized membrane protein YdjX (TVP38/TMEM64 family)